MSSFRAGLLALLLASVAPGFASAAPPAYTPATTPAPGPLRIIGGAHGMGCIAGAVRLPDTAEGMQTIRLSKSFFWGAPQTIATLELLAREAKAAGLPDLYMNDISHPRGGPTTEHAGHQIGLEADVWLDVTPPHPWLPLARREGIEPVSLVRADQRGVDPALWKPADLTLIRLAATLPGVNRVLVNPAIKKQLCEEATGDRSWLRKVRPWYGHASHMHLRLDCPPGQPECPAPPPLPAGDGCDASLQWWFDRLDHPAPPPAHPAPPAPKPALPVACRAILGDTP
jgi:penicillin-insensitive murein endopeptidase